ncbi:hypothetical protein U1Q18_028150 [Sarracenia purpurea var. burkii]
MDLLRFLREALTVDLLLAITETFHTSFPSSAVLVRYRVSSVLSRLPLPSLNPSIAILAGSTDESSRVMSLDIMCFGLGLVRPTWLKSSFSKFLLSSGLGPSESFFV